MPAPEPNQPNLPPAQASFVYWLSGLAPVATNIVTPLMVYAAMRGKPGVTNLQRYNQQVNEVVRQFVSGTIGLVSFFGGGELTNSLLKAVVGKDKIDNKLDDATRHVAMTVGGVAMSFIGFAFVRPKISTDLICALLKKSDNGSHLFPQQKVIQILKRLKASGKTHLTEGQVEQALAQLKSKQLIARGDIRAVMAKLPTPKGVEPGVFAADDLLKGIQNVATSQKPSGWFMKGISRVRDKMETYLIPAGEPNVERTTLVATAFLTTYLGALTGVMWGMNRWLGSNHKKPQELPAPIPPIPADMSVLVAYSSPSSMAAAVKRWQPTQTSTARPQVRRDREPPTGVQFRI